MPDKFVLTLGALQECVSDEKMCAVLNSENSTIANKIILDCLIEQVNCKDDVFNLCNQLFKINKSKEMETVIEKIRTGTYILCFMWEDHSIEACCIVHKVLINHIKCPVWDIIGSTKGVSEVSGNYVVKGQGVGQEQSTNENNFIKHSHTTCWNY